jgi:hypothetical protein
MRHLVGKQGLVVPFGRVTAEVGGHLMTYQQGQGIPPNAVITAVVGDNENDPARSTAKLLETIGIKSEKPESGSK